MCNNTEKYNLIIHCLFIKYSNISVYEINFFLENASYGE